MADEREPLIDFKLRLPQTLKDRIDAARVRNNRSINKEIVARLEASFQEPAAAGDGGARLSEVERRLELLRECLAENGMGPLPKYWD